MTGCTVVGGDVVISAGQDEVREVTAHLEVLVDGPVCRTGDSSDRTYKRFCRKGCDL